MKRINVLIVDDSMTSRRLLEALVNQTPDMSVVGQAKDGLEAVQMAQDLKPDVIVMDIIMPRMDGLEATSEIMALSPTPILLITAGLDHQETEVAFRAIKNGALNVMKKPEGQSEGMQRLIQTIRALADVKVIHHRKRAPQSIEPHRVTTKELTDVTAPQLIAIVASTGGPGALSDILKDLPGDLPVPIVIVQHIAPNFVDSLQRWFSSVTSLKVAIAEEGQIPHPGYIYLAPGNAHLKLNRYQRFILDAQQGTYLHMPSGDVLLDSVAQSYGAAAVGVVLTGMGADGARGLRRMYDVDAFTIAQDQATSVVFGMPAEAIRMNAARSVLSISEIAPALVKLVKTPKEVKHGK